MTPNQSARLDLFPQLVALATGQALVRLVQEHPGMGWDAMLDQIRNDYPDLERARQLIAGGSHDNDCTAGAQVNRVSERPYAENPVGACTEYQGGRA